MKPIRDDALLRDMITDEQQYSMQLRCRRANGISRLEPPDVLAFYDRQIEETDNRIRMLMRSAKQKESR